MNTFMVLDNAAGTLHTLFHLIPSATLHYHPHPMDEGGKAQHAQTCPKSHGWEGAELGFATRWLESEPHATRPLRQSRVSPHSVTAAWRQSPTRMVTHRSRAVTVRNKEPGQCHSSPED